MPSSIGHGIAAVAAGWTAARPAPRWRPLLIQAAILGMLGAAPDLDLLIYRHRAQSHSLGIAAVVACVAAWGRWPIGRTRPRIWLAAFLAWATHPLLDSLVLDRTVPEGIMAFWPFSSAYYQTGFNVFGSITRRCCGKLFFRHNALSIGRELLILVPIAFGVWWVSRKRSPTQA